MLESLRNQRVKDVVRLRNRRHRDREGRFVIEGRREVVRAVQTGFPVTELYYCEEFPAARAVRELIAMLADADVDCQPTSRPVFEKMSYRHNPDGLLAVARTPSLDLKDWSPPDDALLLVATAIEKPGNLGAMLRAADAAGANGVLVADPATDVFNPNVVRASVGTLFGMPVAVAAAPAAREWLAERGVRVIAASPDAKTDYADADYRGGVAIAVGSEHDGLGREWLDGRFETVRIPMAGCADSLNAAMAATLLLFEARRRRDR